MYAYVNERMEFLNSSNDWLSKFPKAYIFYTGLGVFAVFNLLINVGINMFKNAEGYDERSLLFKNQEHKERLLMWFAYLLAGINFLISCVIFYLGLIQINEMNDKMQYIFLPITGLLVLLGVILGLLVAIFRKE